LITTAHGVSGSNNRYWPEIYTNMPIADPERRHPYTDTPTPRRFGTVSPFDPQLFSRVDDFAQELLDGRFSGKYSPLEVARWLEDCAAASLSPDRKGAEARRWAADIDIQSGLGRFFASKLRTGVLWALYDKTGDRIALQEALQAYRRARTAWAEFAGRAKGVYTADITYGASPFLRGHWLDRLEAIDEDIGDMEKQLAQAKPGARSPEVERAVRQALAPPQRPVVACRHTPASRFRPGNPLDVELSLDQGDGRTVRLHYRHVNQAETWQSQEMQWRDNRYRAVITGAYTKSPYPLQYYFELRERSAAWLYPGLDLALANQPYFVVRHA
jgi:hypothetical protein